MRRSFLSRHARSIGHGPHETSSPAIRTRVARRQWLGTLALLVLLGGALAMRLVNLGRYSGLFDEGIRAEQIFLMTRGFRPFQDIFAAQGPLLLDTFFPFYMLFDALLDPPLVALRLVPVLFSLVGLLGIFAIAAQLAGRLGGLLSVLFLTLSPLYLEGSRLALAEVPALAPATLGLACGIRYGRGKGVGWLMSGGALVLIGLLMKPITVAAAIAFASAALLRGRRGLRDLLLVTLGGALITGIVVLLLGFTGVVEQLWEYRKAASALEGFSVRKNLTALRAALHFEPWPLLPFGVLGGLLALLTRGSSALPTLVWSVVGLLLLLTYVPLHGKHIVVAIPALTLLAGCGLALASQALRSTLPPGRRTIAMLPVIAGVSIYLVGWLPLLPQAGQLLSVTADTDVDPAFEQYNGAVMDLDALLATDDFLVTDQPYLAFLAQRMVPPQLVDSSLTRIRSRSLTGQRAIQQTAAYDVRVILLWGDRLRSLPAFKAWVDQDFQVVKVFNRRGDSDRALYLRRDQDFDAARSALTASLPNQPSASFGSQMRLVGALLDRLEVAQGQGTTITLHWELVAPASLDYHVLIDLRDSQGRSLASQEESLSGGAEGTNRWQPGRWMVQSSFAVASTSPGDYELTVSLYDSKAKQTVLVDGSSGSDRVRLGTLRVI